MAETTLLALRPTRLIALPWYVGWILLWIVSGLAFLDPTRLVPDWTLLGFRVQSYLGAILGLIGLLALLRAEIKRLSIKYTITDTRIIRYDGILSRKTNEMPFTKVERIEIDQSLLQRVFKYGDIVMDTGEDTITLASLGHVKLVQGEISKLMAQYARRI